MNPTVMLYLSERSLCHADAALLSATRKLLR
jgi:hypothetical protein